MSKTLLFVAVSLLAACALASAQITDPNPAQKPSVFLENDKQKKDKKITSKSLKGTVTDDTGRPLNGALVTLFNSQTKTKLTFITKQDGRYNFDGLSFTVDYEVAAVFKDMHSESRRLSQYDHTPNVVRMLEVQTPGGDTPAKEAATDAPLTK